MVQRYYQEIRKNRPKALLLTTCQRNARNTRKLNVNDNIGGAKRAENFLSEMGDPVTVFLLINQKCFVGTEVLKQILKHRALLKTTPMSCRRNARSSRKPDINEKRSIAQRAENFLTFL